MYLDYPELHLVRTHKTALLTDLALADKGVVFAFSSRLGGSSQVPYDALNLAYSRQALRHLPEVEQEAFPQESREITWYNRSVLLSAMRAPRHLVSCNQVHGNKVLSVDATTEFSWTNCTPTGAEAFMERSAGDADGLMSIHPKQTLMLMFADCVPLVLAAPHAVAVLHSGWKGCMSHIVCEGIKRICEASACKPSELNLYIGPHIAAQDYQVSQELYLRFQQEFPGVRLGFEDEQGRAYLDMSAVIMHDAQKAGLDQRRIVLSSYSTAQNPDLYFSFRLSKGICGRQGALAYLKDK